MTEQEWLKRYAAHIVAVTGLSETLAEQCTKAESFAVLSEDYEDDPEGAADMEMSYWDWD